MESLKRRFGDWVAVELINQGGNARVFKCRHQDGREAALKLPDVRGPGSERYRRFRDEVQVLRDLGDHPGGFASNRSWLMKDSGWESRKTSAFSFTWS
jgi:serine/threonine protein kinase